MNNLVILHKDSYDVLFDKVFLKSSFFSKDFNQNFIPNIIQSIKELDSFINNDLITFKLEDKLIIYKKSKDSFISLILISEKHVFKKENLTRIAGFYIDKIDKLLSKNEILKNIISLHLKDFTISIIEELTIKFIEYLRKNKLFPRFLYFNYNPNVLGSMSYKKTKADSTSVILYNSQKDHDKEPKDTLLYRSTIREKDLCIEVEKKANPPFEKKLFISKFNNVKIDTNKKNVAKYFTTNFFIDKYFLSKNTMIHLLFNNVFLEDGNKTKNENLIFPITEENENVLLYVLDIYDKTQQIFSVNKENSTEYLDIVNYIELNFTKQDILLIKSKLIVIKYKFLITIVLLDIFEDKNTWNLINNNTNFFKEMEVLFKIVFNETYSTAYD